MQHGHMNVKHESSKILSDKLISKVSDYRNTRSLEQSHSLWANNTSANQEISRFFVDPEDSLSPTEDTAGCPCPSQMNPVFTFPAFFL